VANSNNVLKIKTSVTIADILNVKLFLIIQKKQENVLNYNPMRVYFAKILMDFAKVYQIKINSANHVLHKPV
jgi:hypothetical protein